MRQVLIRHHIQSYTLTAQVLWGTGNAAIKSIFERFFFKTSTISESLFINIMIIKGTS